MHRIDRPAFKHVEHTEQRFVLYTPMPDEDTPAKMQRLLSAR
jgi:hypothetical protein